MFPLVLAATLGLAQPAVDAGVAVPGRQAPQRSPTPPPFPRAFTTQGQLLRFESNGGEGLLLESKLADADHARTFVVCRGAVRPLGPFLRPVAVSMLVGETVHEVQRFLYQAPCADPVFVVRGPGLQAGDFRSMTQGPAFGAVTFVPARVEDARLIGGCALKRGRLEQRLAPTALNDCRLELAGDLNDDGVVDAFVLHDADICRAGTLWLSTPGGWSAFATEVLWCPD